MCVPSSFTRFISSHEIFFFFFTGSFPSTVVTGGCDWGFLCVSFWFGSCVTTLIMVVIASRVYTITPSRIPLSFHFFGPSTILSNGKYKCCEKGISRPLVHTFFCFVLFLGDWVLMMWPILFQLHLLVEGVLKPKGPSSG